MHPLRSLMTLMAVLALSAMVAERAMAAPYVCTAADVGKGVCLSCKTKAKCEAGNPAPVAKGECTVPGEACTVLAGVAVCKPFANTPCSCAKTSQCDPYDPDRVHVCLSGGQTSSTDCSKTTKTCVNGVCVTPATTTTTAAPNTLCAAPAPADGFVLNKPSCTSAVFCSGGNYQGTTECPSGTYFDMNEGNCLSLPPAPCGGCGSGACPDKSDCKKFYVCDAGVLLDEETCDAATPDFDIVTNECVPTPGTCTANDKCTYVVTTTAPTTISTASNATVSTASNATASTVSNATISTVSNATVSTVASTTTASTRPTLCTATNVGKRYPYPGNCKKYWSCRLVTTGVYAYVESTCLSTLVFNAATSYCDTPANVPTCVPPS